jgi:hypothetical protein
MEKIRKRLFVIRKEWYRILNFLAKIKNYLSRLVKVCQDNKHPIWMFVVYVIAQAF